MLIVLLEISDNMPDIKVKYKTLMNYWDMMDIIRKALPKKKFQLCPEHHLPKTIEEFENSGGDDYKIEGNDGQVLASINIRNYPPKKRPIDCLLMEYQGSRDILMKIRQKLPMDKVSLFHE